MYNDVLVVLCCDWCCCVVPIQDETDSEWDAEATDLDADLDSDTDEARKHRSIHTRRHSPASL